MDSMWAVLCALTGVLWALRGRLATAGGGGDAGLVARGAHHAEHRVALRAHAARRRRAAGAPDAAGIQAVAGVLDAVGAGRGAGRRRGRSVRRVQRGYGAPPGDSAGVWRAHSRAAARTRRLRAALAARPSHPRELRAPQVRGAQSGRHRASAAVRILQLLVY